MARLEPSVAMQELELQILRHDPALALAANAGPTVAGGMVYVHSGYNGNAGGSNVLIAFSVDGK